MLQVCDILHILHKYITYSTQIVNAQDGKHLDSETTNPQGGSKVQAAAEQTFKMATVEEKYILFELTPVN